MGAVDRACPRSGDAVRCGDVSGVIMRPQGVGLVLVRWRAKDTRGKIWSVKSIADGRLLKPSGPGKWEL